MIKSKLSFFFFFLLLSNICAQTTPAVTENYIDTKLEEIRFDTKMSDSEKEKSLSKLKKESEKIGYKWGILKSGRRIIEVYESQSKNKEIVKLATEPQKN